MRGQIELFYTPQVGGFKVQVNRLIPVGLLRRLLFIFRNTSPMGPPELGILSHSEGTENAFAPSKRSLVRLTQGALWTIPPV